MKKFITLTLSLLLLVPELLAGNFGLALGLPVYGAVCLSVAFGEVYGIAAAGLSAMILDIIYDRPYPWWSICAILILYISVNTVRRMQRKQPVSALSAGAVCGALIALYNIFYPLFTDGDLPGSNPFALLVFHISGGILFMFLLVLIFDAVNLRSNLPRFGIYGSHNETRGLR